MKLLWIALAGLALLLPATSSATEPEVRLLVSNPAPYVGEETLLTLELRYRGRLPGRPVVRWPNLHRFSVEDLPPLPPRREGAQLVESARRLVRPLAAGAETLAGAVAVAGREFTAAPLTVRVRALPRQGRPVGFAGAVGRAELSLRGAGSGTREVAVVLRGAAPLDAFPRPELVPGRGERLVFLGEDRTGSVGEVRERTFRYLYLPGADSRGQLSASLVALDPQTGAYRRLYAGLGERGHPTPWRFAIAAGLVAATLGVWVLMRRRRSLDHHLERLLERPTAGLCRERILADLTRKEVSRTARHALQRLWECEDLDRFGDRPAGPSELAKLRREAAALLRNAVDKSGRIP